MRHADSVFSGVSLWALRFSGKMAWVEYWTVFTDRINRAYHMRVFSLRPDMPAGGKVVVLEESHRLRVRGASYLFHPEPSGFALRYSHCWVRTRAKGTSAANIWKSERYGQIGVGPAALPQSP